VRSGAWHRLRHGAYVSGAVWEALDPGQRHRLLTRAVLQTAQASAVASHRSAVVEHTGRWWDLDLSEVDLTRVDARSGRREAGVRQHRGLLTSEDIEVVNGIGVTSATRTALDITTMTDVEHSLVVVDALINEGKTSRESMARRYAQGMQVWPRTLTTDLVMRLADGRSESPGESRSRYLFWQQGLPAPELQFEFRDSRGMLLGISDFAWPGHGVFGEFDGKVKYSSLLREGESPADAVVREKLREQRIVEETGWSVVRLVWSDLYRPEETAERIRRLLARGGPRPLIA
jgi:hypothetical protein